MTELNDAPLEGSTIFYRSFLGHMALESCWFDELNYAIISRTRCNTKKWRRSNLFRLTNLKHGLLEGSTILLQYSSISHTKLESFRLGELKYAILAGWDVRLKNKTFWKCKTWHFSTTVHGHYSMGCLWNQSFIRYSYSSQTPLDCSRLGEQKNAISTQ